MGRFFTSTQIYNPKQLDRSTIIDHFYKGMKELGYIPCNSDESEISYIMRFADNCKWVTITSDAYEQGNQFAQADTGKIAKMLKTVCINTTVIDSDCAILDLYDESGKKKDALIMGRADDYFGHDIPDPIERVWSPLLEGNHTWEQLLKVRKDNYIFIEEGLLKIAKILGIAPSDITFSDENKNENEDKTVILDFKKTRSTIIKTQTGNKVPKTVNLNSAFKQIVGEALAPYGFRAIRGRYPYLIRSINNEILHVITLCPENPEYPADKAFAVMCGVATVYRKKLTIDLSPDRNRDWLNYMSRFYTSFTQNRDATIVKQLNKSCYYSNNSDSLASVLKTCSENVIKYVLPTLNTTNTIEACLTYFQEFLMPCNPKKCTKLCTYYPDEDEAFLYFLSPKQITEHPDFLDDFITDVEFNKWVMAELDKRKNENSEVLKILDLFSSQED